MRTLNLGILAHVDAGKTTLTERLLHAAGVIDEIGSVDDGTTQTDSLALEQRRGITIKSAVASFAIDDVAVNLIDTPGHPDFIAEVERVLSVLDGAVLLVSAVEGVQPQSRILMRALQRMRIPTLLFVNKIDRRGASDQRVLRMISERLSPAIIVLGTTRELGTPGADFVCSDGADAGFTTALTELVAEHNDAVLAAYVADRAGIPYPRLRAELAAQTSNGLVHPVFFGSAMTGAGLAALMAGMVALLPAREGDVAGPVSGTVFKIERGPAGEKVAYVRMFSGLVRTRDRVQFGRIGERKVTAIDVFADGSAVRSESVRAGQIGKLRGLTEVQIGDAIGTPRDRRHHRFAPPTLETVVVPTRPSDKGALHDALAQLAEQDPLINVRQDEIRKETSVSLYGEVQKEVIAATLAADFGVDVSFHETTTLCIERPIGTGKAIEVLRGETNPFSATVGLRVEPAPAGSGVAFRLDVDPREVPTHIFKTAARFGEFMSRHVHRTFREGLCGWEVTDCIVTMSSCGYFASDGARAQDKTPRTTAADFRKLTPLVLMLALERAATAVCEPMVRVSIEAPSECAGAVLACVGRVGRLDAPPSTHGDLFTIATTLPAARLPALQQQVPGLTGGEGVVEADMVGYEPVNGTPPVRRRTTPNPLNREEYLRAGRPRI